MGDLVARRRGLAAFLLPWLLGAPALAAQAWSPQTRLAIAEQAARIAPPDLWRQIDRHLDQFRRGATDGRGEVAGEAARAIAEIREHRPFAEVVYRLGRIAALTAAVNDPLAGGSPWEGDFRVYVESAWPRFSPVFYGEGRQLGDAADLRRMLQRAAARRTALAPWVDVEYRRVGGPPGLDRFDDRSTAFGVAAVAFSHAVSDAAAVLRYVWIEAGGADPRPLRISRPES